MIELIAAVIGTCVLLKAIKFVKVFENSNITFPVAFGGVTETETEIEPYADTSSADDGVKDWLAVSGVVVELMTDTFEVADAGI